MAGRGRVVASILSLLLPGAGQLYAGARRRGLVLLGVTAALLLGALALAAWWPAAAVDRRLVAAVPAVDLALLALRSRARSRSSFPAARIRARPRSSTLSRASSVLRVDYYALVNLRGFADLVDALGGVVIAVKERLVDEVTRPA